MQTYFYYCLLHILLIWRINESFKFLIAFAIHIRLFLLIIFFVNGNEIVSQYFIKDYGTVSTFFSISRLR